MINDYSVKMREVWHFRGHICSSCVFATTA